MNTVYLANTIDEMTPSRQLVAITPNDGTDLATPIRALRVTGTAGNVAVVGAGNTDAEIFVIPLAANEEFVAVIRRVRATGTTATGLVGFV